MTRFFSNSLRINSQPKRRAAFIPQFEALEKRDLLAASIWLDGTILRIEGSIEDDVITVRTVNPTKFNPTSLEAAITNPSGTLGIQAFFDYRTHVSGIQISALAGDDVVRNETSIPSTIFGGYGDDLLVGGSAADLILGEQGADRIFGMAGNDVLHSYSETSWGEYDSNFVAGGEGDDLIEGANGHDWLVGGSGSDSIYGQAGSDKIEGDKPAVEAAPAWFGDFYDDLFDDINVDTDPHLAADTGAVGDDALYGGWDGDLMYGGGGADLLHGQRGDDYLYGGNGEDTLRGQSGRDWLSGDAHNDELYGGSEADALFGGNGDDLLAGGGNSVNRLPGVNGDPMVLGDWMEGGDGDDTIFFDFFDMVDLMPGSTLQWCPTMVTGDFSGYKLYEG